MFSTTLSCGLLVLLHEPVSSSWEQFVLKFGMFFIVFNLLHWLQKSHFEQSITNETSIDFQKFSGYAISMKSSLWTVNLNTIWDIGWHGLNQLTFYDTNLVSKRPTKGKVPAASKLKIPYNSRHNRQNTFGHKHKNIDLIHIQAENHHYYVQDQGLQIVICKPDTFFSAFWNILQFFCSCWGTLYFRAACITAVAPVIKSGQPDQLY